MYRYIARNVYTYIGTIMMDDKSVSNKYASAAAKNASENVHVIVVSLRRVHVYIMSCRFDKQYMLPSGHEQKCRRTRRLIETTIIRVLFSTRFHWRTTCVFVRITRSDTCSARKYSPVGFRRPETRRKLKRSGGDFTGLLLNVFIIQTVCSMAVERPRSVCNRVLMNRRQSFRFRFVRSDEIAWRRIPPKSCARVRSLVRDMRRCHRAYTFYRRM